MNKKYDDEFFDDLDKTTDLLKAFKPHIHTQDGLEGLDDLYSEFNINKNKNEHVSSVQKIDIIDEINFVIDEEKESKNNENKEIDKKVEKTNISEIIDKMQDSVIETKNLKKEKEEKIEIEEKKQNKKGSKFNFFELTFVGLSVVFIICCAVILGLGMFDDDSKKETKKLNLLSTALTKNNNIVTSGDGLYLSDNNYIYKGQNVNNYVSYSNMMWRILKTNSDGTIDLVSDDFIDTQVWNDDLVSYNNSSIHLYLNNKFIKNLDKSYLTTTKICLNDVNDINIIECTNVNEDNYVRLLSITEYLQSKNNNTFIASITDTLWLYNKSNNMVWYVLGNDVERSLPNKALGIKPVVRLQKNVVIESGDGTQANPYKLSL